MSQYTLLSINLVCINKITVTIQVYSCMTVTKPQYCNSVISSGSVISHINNTRLPVQFLMSISDVLYPFLTSINTAK